MIDLERHDLILKQILRDFFRHEYLQGQLALKGGTCLYIFYDLNRFSTDLDLNLRSDTLNHKDISKIISKYLSIDDFSSKRFTWFWLGSYEKGMQKIKIEINKRDFPDKYINQNFYGITVPILAPEYMFAHKLCAITDRRKLANRDLYDAWFMFEKNWQANEEIIKARTGKSRKEYYGELIQFIEKSKTGIKILDGLGEVLDEKQKLNVKKNLMDELLFHLNIRAR